MNDIPQAKDEKRYVHQAVVTEQITYIGALNLNLPTYQTLCGLSVTGEGKAWYWVTDGKYITCPKCKKQLKATARKG